MSRFRVTGHFEKSAQNDPKMTLNPTSSIVPHIFITTVPESQISLRFALRPAFFNIQAILRQVHQMTPKWPWILQGHRYPIYVLLVSMSPKFHFVSLYDEPFSSYRPFWEKRTKWPQNDLESYKVKLSYIYVCFTSIHEAQISLFCSKTNHYRVTGQFWEKCTKWPQLDLEPYKVKYTIYV